MGVEIREMADANGHRKLIPSLYRLGTGWAVLLTAVSTCFAEPHPLERDPAAILPFVLQREPAPDDPEQLTCRFTQEQLALLEKLNRSDVRHLHRLKEVVVPNRWDFDELVYSPLPLEWSPAKRHPKVLVVSQPAQVFGGYENGLLVRWGPVNSGRKARPTPEGLFYLNWKSPGRRSTVNRAWFLRWYFNFVNTRGISFHEYEMPGRPASHGCIRLLGRDAKWVYDWGEQWQLGPKGWDIERQGTPVLILGRYAFGRGKRWLSPEYLATGGRLKLDSALLADIELVKVTDSEEAGSAPEPGDTVKPVDTVDTEPSGLDRPGT